MAACKLLMPRDGLCLWHALAFSRLTEEELKAYRKQKKNDMNLPVVGKGANVGALNTRLYKRYSTSAKQAQEPYLAFLTAHGREQEANDLRVGKIHSEGALGEIASVVGVQLVTVQENGALRCFGQGKKVYLWHSQENAKDELGEDASKAEHYDLLLPDEHEQAAIDVQIQEQFHIWSSAAGNDSDHEQTVENESRTENYPSDAEGGHRKPVASASVDECVGHASTLENTVHPPVINLEAELEKEMDIWAADCRDPENESKDLSPFEEVLLELGKESEPFKRKQARQTRTLLDECNKPSELTLKAFLKGLLPKPLLIKLQKIPKPILIGDFCSGAGTAVAVAKALVSLIFDLTGRTVDVRVAFVVEIDQRKRNLIQQSFGNAVEHVFEDVSKMGQPRTVSCFC